MLLVRGEPPCSCTSTFLWRRRYGKYCHRRVPPPWHCRPALPSLRPLLVMSSKLIKRIAWGGPYDLEKTYTGIEMDPLYFTPGRLRVSAFYHKSFIKITDRSSS